MLKTGQLVKFKFNGLKRKGRILSPNDIITEDCIQALILDEHPLCYSTTLAAFDLNNEVWHTTQAAGDRVNEGHTVRVYIKLIEPGH